MMELVAIPERSLATPNTRRERERERERERGGGSNRTDLLSRGPLQPREGLPSFPCRCLSFGRTRRSQSGGPHHLGLSLGCQKPSRCARATLTVPSCQRSRAVYVSTVSTISILWRWGEATMINRVIGLGCREILSGVCFYFGFPVR
jgi:hypothetical protein